MDEIIIKDLKVRCIIGTLPRERRVKQRLIINLSLACNCETAGKSDSLNDAVNYKDVCDKVVALCLAGKFMLIEKLAHEIGTICLTDKNVRQVTVRIDKPGALPLAASAAVIITRKQTRQTTIRSA